MLCGFRMERLVPSRQGVSELMDPDVGVDRCPSAYLRSWGLVIHAGAWYGGREKEVYKCQSQSRLQRGCCLPSSGRSGSSHLPAGGVAVLARSLEKSRLGD